MTNYEIRPFHGLACKIGEFVSMLEYTRNVTKEDVKNRTMSELDFLPGEDPNSIGALLLHIAAIEFVHQVITFEWTGNRGMEDEMNHFGQIRMTRRSLAKK